MSNLDRRIIHLLVFGGSGLAGWGAGGFWGMCHSLFLTSVGYVMGYVWAWNDLRRGR